MRRKREQSIIQYISVRFTGIILVMVFIMACFITYFSNEIIRKDINSQIMRETRYDYVNIKMRDGQITILDDFVYQENNINKIVLTEDNVIIGGTYPDEELLTYPISKRSVRSVSCSSGSYYVFDRPVKVQNPDKTQSPTKIYIRSVARKQDMTSQYKVLKYISYCFIIMLFIISIFITRTMSRRLTRPIRDICQTAESIGQEGNLSRRISYQGFFAEIDTMARANNRMLDRLEELFERQNQFTSDVAHELRTPISVVKAECQYGRKYMNSKEDFTLAIDTIERQIDKTNLLITQLLKLSRLDQGRNPIHFEQANLKELVESVCENEQQQSTKNITIETCLFSAEALIDISLMTIVIDNLINNALKYSDDGSTIQVSLQEQEDSVQFIVTDHGCGMTEYTIKHIFDRFYRDDKARNSEGFGLGLSITKKIVLIHHGTLAVHSQPGKGSTFILTLPKDPGQSESSDPDSAI